LDVLELLGGDLAVAPHDHEPGQDPLRDELARDLGRSRGLGAERQEARLVVRRDLAQLPLGHPAEVADAEPHDEEEREGRRDPAATLDGLHHPIMRDLAGEPPGRLRHEPWGSRRRG
jgi:hypothetical protein